MAHEWILEVLQDIYSYAAKNGLPALAAQIVITQQVAMTEIRPAGAAGKLPGSGSGADQDDS